MEKIKRDEDNYNRQNGELNRIFEQFTDAITALEVRMDKVEDRLDRVEAKIDSMHSDLIEIKMLLLNGNRRKN